jgi:L-ascorbate 6-phosphate lactonase
MTFALCWIGQGGFLFAGGGKTICVDSYLSNSLEKLKQQEGFRRLFPPPLEPKDLHADLVICTHNHIDHLDENTLRAVPQRRTLFAGPQSCLEHFGRLGIPWSQLVPLNAGQPVSLDQITV